MNDNQIKGVPLPQHPEIQVQQYFESDAIFSCDDEFTDNLLKLYQKYSRRLVFSAQRAIVDHSERHEAYRLQCIVATLRATLSMMTHTSDIGEGIETIEALGLEEVIDELDYRSIIKE